jgi:hypothetical protein
LNNISHRHLFNFPKEREGWTPIFIFQTEIVFFHCPSIMPFEKPLAFLCEISVAGNFTGKHGLIHVTRFLAREIGFVEGIILFCIITADNFREFYF